MGHPSEKLCIRIRPDYVYWGWRELERNVQMRSHLLEYAWWLAAPTLLLSGVWVAMRRRGLYRQYPYFVNYIALQVLIVPIMLVLQFNYSAYYYAYYVEITLSALLSFAVLQDLLKNGFQTSEAVTKLSGFLLAASLVILVVAGMAAAGSQSWGTPDYFSSELALMTRRSVLIVQCSLVILLLVLRRSLGITRRSLLFGITLGLGLFATVNLLLPLLVAYHRFVSMRTPSRILGAADVLVCGIWLAYSMAGSNTEHAYSWTRAVPR